MLFFCGIKGITEWLKRQRRDRLLTSADVSTKLGMAKCSYSVIDAGVRPPTYEHLESLAALYGVDGDVLKVWSLANHEKYGSVVQSLIRSLLCLSQAECEQISLEEITDMFKKVRERRDAKRESGHECDSSGPPCPSDGEGDPIA